MLFYSPYFNLCACVILVVLSGSYMGRKVMVMVNGISVVDFSSIRTPADVVRTFEVIGDTEPCYELFMDFVASNSPLLASESSAREVEKALGDVFFYMLSWYGTSEPERLASLPVCFLHRIFSGLGKSTEQSQWWDYEGIDFLNSGYLSSEKLKQIFTDLLQVGFPYSDKLGMLCSRVKNAEVLRVARDAFFKHYGEKGIEGYKTAFLDYVAINRYCPVEIGLEITELYNDTSAHSLHILERLFINAGVCSHPETLVPAIMEVVPNRRKLVGAFLTNKNELPVELRADIFIRYYSPKPLGSGGPFTLIYGEWDNYVVPVLKNVYERLVADTRALLPETDNTPLPLALMVESAAFKGTEGYRYLLELDEFLYVPEKQGKTDLHSLFSSD